MLSESVWFCKHGRLNEQLELITAIQLIGDDFLLCSQHREEEQEHVITHF